MHNFTNTSKKGVSIIEVIIGGTIFAVMAIGIYRSFFTLSEGIRATRAKTAAVALMNDEIELARNTPYQSIGIQNGYPPGVLAATSTIVKEGFSFTVLRTVRNIDDPFDGQIGSTTNDTAPADYRLVEINISCPNCKNFSAIKNTTTAAPKNLELSSGGGALFLQIFDANGLPVSQANIHIENLLVTPALTIDDTTNTQGLLQLVDIPPSVNGYKITATKSGYSTDKTYTPGLPQNPNPIKPDATVTAGVVTQASFAIDRVSTINLTSKNQICVPVPNVAVKIDGTKTIGLGPPDILKYSTTSVTDAVGSRVLSNMEWDTYGFSLIDPAYDLAGAIPLTPLILAPDTAQNLQLLVENKNPKTLLATVKDSGTGLSVSDATVTLSKTGFSSSVITGRGSIPQTDWSGGPGQATSTNPAQFFNSDGNIEINAPAGEMRLTQFGGYYQPSGWLESSAYDLGSVSNLHNISWAPVNQPQGAGSSSVQFQFASNNDGGVWNFVGPDNTPATYYTTANTDISNHNGKRYVRYRAYLATETATSTPIVSDVSFTFTTACMPPGQAFFNALAAGTYTLTVTHPAYQMFSDTEVEILGDTQTREVLLNP